MSVEEDKIFEAVGRCLDWEIPFVACRLPGDESVMFFSNPSFGKHRCGKTGARRFVISTWNRTCPDIVIEEELDAASTLRLSDTGHRYRDVPRPCNRSTSKADYVEQVKRIVGNLRSRKGKTVLSRVKCGRLPEDAAANRCWTRVLKSYFSINPGTFGYCYFTPLTGAWLGASPEMLLGVDFGSNRFMTMSLAGTRPLNSGHENTPWDEKNMYEHGLVTDFIMTSLTELGLAPECGPLHTKNLPSLQHLCNVITGNLQDASPRDIISRLNPTPALAGYPVEMALDEIGRNEEHPRLCYGGYVALEDRNRLDAYVNLRCLHFHGDSYCMYGGGGLTEDSDPEQEWCETEVKMSVLERIIGSVTVVNE